MAFNYVRAIADFTNNFCFSRGAEFTTAKKYQHIVPALYKRIWELDNEKSALLWEFGNQGGVSGDVFVKVAYEPAFQNSVGEWIPGRVRILPLNAAFCFPEFHPHDRDRLIRFKLKYRFWGTSAEGTRQVYTYTEIMTDDVIEEYVNDELIDSRPNPLGEIPIAYTQNFMVSGSPWGLSDIADIVSLNREFNEKATDISQIINYHAAPVTIIKGAKAGNLEKGANKVWAGLPKDADVFNLQGTGDLAGAMNYLQVIKTAIHEMTGVPESALGQMQPISNTSGVALSIMYQPMMQRWNHKKLTYGRLLKKINRLALKTLFCFEPNAVLYDPDTEGIFNENFGQQPAIDPLDPGVYEHTVEWAPPLPVDALIKLNEIQQKMALGLESKRGALRELGDAFPDEKMQEIFEELVQDAKDNAALDLLQAQFTSSIMALTGIIPGENGGPVAPPAAPGPDGQPAPTAPGPAPMAPADLGLQDITAEGAVQAMSDLVTKAYGTKLGTARVPSASS